MKKKTVLIWVLSLLIVLLAATVLAIRPIQRGFWKAQILSERTIDGAAVREEESNSILGGLTRLERTYDLSNGDRVVFGRMAAGEKDSSYHMVRSDILDCREGTVWYYDYETSFWKTTPLAEMELGTTCVYIDGDAQDYFIYVPIGYQMLENQSLRENGSKGYLSVTKEGGRWRLRLYGSFLQSGTVCDYSIVRSSGDEPLLNAAEENVMKLWSTYCNNGDGRWCYDGYYFPAADTYIPTGDGCLFRCVAAYFAKSMEWQANSSRCAADLSISILDTISLQQNEEGYFPTMSGSTWLAADYGIAPGFYDTRFNSDLLMIYEHFMSRTDGFRQVASRYFDFYLEFAEKNHYETENGGYLIWDYNNATQPVHCSLNHQLAEMLILYRFASLLERPELEEMADRMLLGIEDTCEGWIMEDNNLHYCYMDGGVFGKDDYPYLTYNDLYTMQQEFGKMGRGRNEALDRLMEAKLQWMQANGVTGYYS